MSSKSRIRSKVQNNYTLFIHKFNHFITFVQSLSNTVNIQLK